MTLALLTIPLGGEEDLVALRQRSRHLAALLGFDAGDQTRIATALSEVAREVLRHFGGGEIAFSVAGRTTPQVLTVTAAGRSPTADGAASRAPILDGTLGGVVAARRLMDQFHLDEGPDGVPRIVLRKVFPPHAPLATRSGLGRIAAEVAALRGESAVAELQRQNQELVRALDALRERQDELVRVNGELEDTNRGVVALFAELDEKADHLRRADEMKSRFLSNMSHEFRTPLNAIRGLSNLLLERADGDLSAEQERQVSLIARAARELGQLVDDLLDLAKVEAGKVVVRPTTFDARNLFAALRGMLRPLLLTTSVSLVFDDPDLEPLTTDEGKVSQILRNLISNALKFTEHGEVRVSARPSPDGRQALFAVRDTGIGIAPDDQELIFREFTQLDSPLQRRAKGTGLGLPLSRKLAGLLGGRILVESAPGAGSTFTLEIPAAYHAVEDLEPVPAAPPGADALPAVLVVEDNAEMLLVYERYLRETPYEVLRATTLTRARRLLARRRVRAIVLDILLTGEDSWSFLAELKNTPATAAIPVIVVTQVDDPQKATALGADAFSAKPPGRQWLVSTLQRLVARASARRALVVDDEEASRYLWSRILVDIGWQSIEADGGLRALELARAERPDAILLDLNMPAPGGLAVLDALRADETARGIPVVVMSSKVLDEEEAQAIRERGARFLPKSLSVAEARRTLAALLAGAGGRAEHEGG